MSPLFNSVKSKIVESNIFINYFFVVKLSFVSISFYTVFPYTEFNINLILSASKSSPSFLAVNLKSKNFYMNSLNGFSIVPVHPMP
jgi:hypothetical protein